MTISQLKEDSKFLRLTDKQKAWVVAYCESNGDKLKAAHAAFNCRTDGSAQSISYQQLRNPLIKALVSDFVELVETRVTKDEMLSILGDRFRRCSDDKYILEFAAQIAEMEGWNMKPSAPPKSTGQTDFEKVSALEN
jgi:hypothetical protein